MEIPCYTDPRFRRAAGDSWHPGGLALTRRGLELCRFARGAVVLDIGCGKGETLRLLRSLPLDAVGLDKENQASSDLPVFEGDASSPPFADGTFDGIVCECVLSLLPAPDKALGAFCRMLKSGGRLMLSDVYAQEGGKEARLPRPEPGSCLEGALPRSLLEDLLKQAGLRIVFFEDHPEALREFAAKLIWYGGVPLKSLCPASGCGIRPGYGLWIAEKAKP